MAACIDDPNFCILSELCSCDMYHLLHHRKSKLSLKRKLYMAIDAARGVLYMHSSKPQLLHRDIKTSNLLVDEKYSVKISDFTFSCTLNEHDFVYTKYNISSALHGTPGKIRF
eukprot:TRINITY_DN5298_c0_g1_i2.p1 TRINITY_DN5298_c0_g1~~TRINITY_DN5298_c0_g1_i2.p1  ORF type:complete len:131 (-),score=7.82 TRINITY_DN5298_c0_g1_i2:401-739(-)